MWVRGAAICSLIMCMTGFVLAEEPAEKSKNEFGLKFIYPGDAKPVDYLSSHPCISGGWEFKSETMDHVIGNLHYINDNTQPADVRYVGFGIRIAKPVAIDLKKFRGTLVLQRNTLKPKEGKRPESSDASLYRLIAYTDATAGKPDANMLFSRFLPLHFSPKQLTGVVTKSKYAHTKRSMIDGNYQIRGDWGFLELLPSETVTEEMIDKLVGKTVIVAGMYRRGDVSIGGAPGVKDEFSQRPSLEIGEVMVGLDGFVARKISVK